MPEDEFAAPIGVAVLSIMGIGEEREMIVRFVSLKLSSELDRMG